VFDDDEEEDAEEVEDVEEQEAAVESSPKRGKKRKENPPLRKAPQAPKRFKSSYICFFMAKQPEIKAELGEKATVTEISKRSAEMWRNLPALERVHWDEVAAKDKQRYLLEKSNYTGPWQVPFKRHRKDPSAPKRPMSAFLLFSQGKRQQIKEQNPSMKNTEVSRLLGERWRNASDEEKEPFIREEREQREKYKVAIAEWRKDFEQKKEEQRRMQSQQYAHMSMQYPPPDAGEHHAHPPMHYPPTPGMHPPPSPQHHYGHPPPGPPPPPYYYGHHYSRGAPPPPPPGPYGYAPPGLGGKQPIILAPTGMPRYAPPPPPPPMPPQQHHGYPSAPSYEEHHDHGGSHSFDYMMDRISEPQTAE